MAGIKALIGLAFLASIGITFLILGCSLPKYNNYWPLFVLIFYVLCPLPCILAKRHVDDWVQSSVLWEICLFITAIIVVSAYGLPMTMAHNPLQNPVIHWGACFLVMASNTVVFLTILGFFYVFSSEDSFSYSNW